MSRRDIFWNFVVIKGNRNKLDLNCDWGALGWKIKSSSNFVNVKHTFSKSFLRTEFKKTEKIYKLWFHDAIILKPTFTIQQSYTNCGIHETESDLKTLVAAALQPGFVTTMSILVPAFLSSPERRCIPALPRKLVPGGAAKPLCPQPHWRHPARKTHPDPYGFCAGMETPKAEKIQIFTAPEFNIFTYPK